MTDTALPDFGTSDDPDLDGDPGSHDPFAPAALSELPPGLARAALDALAAFGRRTGVMLEVTPFVPTRAARRTGYGYSNGEPVIGLETWRGVGEVRIGGLPGLLVAEVTAVEDETGADALAHGADVFFVAFATAADAERVARAPRPGFPLPLDRGVEAAGR